MRRVLPRLAFVLVALVACSTETTPETSTSGTEPPVEVPGGSAADGGETPRGDASAAPDAGGPDSATDASTNEPAPAEDAGPAPSDAGAPPPAEDAGAAACTALVQRGTDVASVEVVGSSQGTELTGGTVEDGTYVLTAATHYVEVGTNGNTRPLGRETIRLAGGTLEDVHVFPNDGSQRFTATLTASGTSLRMTRTCFTYEGPFVPAAELGDWGPLEHELTHYEARPTTLTVWVPRGNHGSIVRVYTKVPPGT